MKKKQPLYWFNVIVGIATILSCVVSVCGVLRVVKYVEVIKIEFRQRVLMMNEIKNEIKNEVKNMTNIKNEILTISKDENRDSSTSLSPQNSEGQSVLENMTKKENDIDNEKEKIRCRHKDIFCQ